MRLRTHIPVPRTSPSATLKITQEKPKKTQEKPAEIHPPPNRGAAFRRGALWARTSAPPAGLSPAPSGEIPPTLLGSKIGGPS